MKKQQGRRCNETEARKTSKPEMQSTVTNSKMDVIDLPSLYKKMWSYFKAYFVNDNFANPNLVMLWKRVRYNLVVQVIPKFDDLSLFEL